jgi:hypothetical protein
MIQPIPAPAESPPTNPAPIDPTPVESPPAHPAPVESFAKPLHSAAGDAPTYTS